MRKPQFEAPEYDVQDILNAVRCAFYAEYKRPCDKNVDIDTAELVINKPFEMPYFLRKWLLTAGESENESICFLRRYV
jgi:hypothetical protein